MNLIKDQVAEFHKTAQITCPGKPIIPSDDIVRLRIRLIAEEFVELLEATFDQDNNDNISDIRNIETTLKAIINVGNIKVNLKETCDACCDINYVVEGLFQYYGVNSEPFQAEVHRSNMTKFPNGVVNRRADGKIIKPASFESPKMQEELEKQGWKE